MSKPVLEHEDFFVIRTPRQSLTGLLTLDPSADATRAALTEWLAEPHVREALYLASPSLLGQVDIWRKDPVSKRGKKIEQALLKYMIRMKTRPTPFGLFSGIHTGAFGAETNLVVGDEKNDSRATRLDMFYLTKLRAHVAKANIRNDRLLFRPNPSHYFIADECRYIEAYQSGQSWQYRLSTVEANDYFTWLMRHAEAGASFNQLAADFLEQFPDFERDDIEGYLEQLINESLLQPMLSLPLTGAPSDLALLDSLRALGEQDFAGALEKAISVLKEQDEKRIAAPEDYESLFERLSDLPVQAEENKLFQSDLYKDFSRCEISHQLAARLTKQLSLLKVLGQPHKSGFHDLIRRFNGRYEGQMVRLDKLLDEESGISFSEETGYETPLLAGLRLAKPGSGSPSSGALESILDRKITKAVTAPENTGQSVIRFKSKDFQQLVGGATALGSMPASFGALVSLYEDEGGQALLKLNGTFGPSAGLFLGRFAHLNRKLHDHLTEHLKREEAHSEDVIFAEIAHMPEGRVGNVIARPHLRQYEIVFMADSSLDHDYQIPISDLYVWVEGGFVKLWSRRLQKQIIPRLSCAHNFARRSLSAYRFLSMAQQQYGAPPRFALPSSLAQATYVPRIMLDDLVLSEATWRIPRPELEELMVGAKINLEKFKALVDKYKLDSFVAYSVNDNVLNLDLRNPLMLDILLAETKGRVHVELKEVLFSKYRSAVRSGDGRSFNNEVVVPFLNEGATPYQTFRENPQASIEAPYIKRRFSPGSEWLSLKVYTGNTTAESILSNQLLPLVDETKGLYRKWFFIRYSDPDWHLRLRFHGEPEQLHGELLPRLNRALGPLVENGAVHKLESFTYEREVERYGGPAAMELAETLFMEDSWLVARTMRAIEEHGEDLRWRTTLLTTDTLLSRVGYSDDEKLQLLTDLRDGFGHEFSETAALRKQLGKKYRAFEETIWSDFEGIASGEYPGSANVAQQQLFKLLHDWQTRSEPYLEALSRLLAAPEKLTCGRDKLLSSLIHMHNNRMFKAYGRQQEFVMHDFLRRTYFSQSRRSQVA